jgi:hypothetical protein
MSDLSDSESDTESTSRKGGQGGPLGPPAKESWLFDVGGLHVCGSIHEVIAYMHVFTMFTLILMGTSFIHIFDGTFFRFGAPIFIDAETTIHNNVIFVVLILFTIFARVLATVSEEVGAWVTTALPPPQAGGRNTPRGERDRRYWMIMLTRVVGSVMYWFNYAYSLIMVRSQISFTVALIFADLGVYAIGKHTSILYRLRGRVMDAKSFERILGVVTFVQILAIPCFFVIFQITGLTTSPYFVVGPKLLIFSTLIENPAEYAFIVVIAFVDQLIASFVRNIIDDWHTSYLQNTERTHDEMILSRTEGVCIFMLKRFMAWLRILFVLFFLVSQFLFVIVYALADVLATVITTHRSLTAPAGAAAGGPSDRAAAENTRTHIIVLAVVQAAETLLLLLTLILTGLVDTTYFSWIHHAIIFGNDISGQSVIVLLLVYIGIERVGATLYNDIILPDYTNWIYGASPAPGPDPQPGALIPELRRGGYSHLTNLLILSITRVDFWFRFLMLIQFVLSNVYFVIPAAAVDIVLGAIVLFRHVRVKDKKLKIGESLKLMQTDHLRVMQNMWTNQRERENEIRKRAQAGESRENAAINVK